MQTEETPKDVNKICVGPNSTLSGVAPTCKNCPNAATCASPNAIDIKEKIKRNLADVQHKLLVLSGKGGVGKSTVAVQLARLLTSYDLKVGLLDVDICGPSVPLLLGLSDAKISRAATGWLPVWTCGGRLAVMSVGFLLKERNEAVIWRGPKKTALIANLLADVDWEVDVLVVDCPPGTSDEHMSVVSLVGGQALVVSTPSPVAVEDVIKELDFCKKTHTPVLGVLENMKKVECPGCNSCFDLFEDGAIENYCENNGFDYLGNLRFVRNLERGDRDLKELKFVVEKIMTKLSIKKTKIF